VINEVLPFPHADWNEDGSVGVGDEYIELMNLGATSINIKNWRLDNGDPSIVFTLPDVSLLPRQILVFFHFETGISLGDSGGTVRLVKPDGTVADIYIYPPVEAMDRTWCRLPGKSGALEFACQPSPGRPNIPFTYVPAPAGGEGACALADTVPPEMAWAECGCAGAGIWNEAEGSQVWMSKRWKWDVFVE
jgi:hypothetical protein